jgi:AcrR family transcriptional regulator
VPPPRRRQADRRAATRAQLIDAAIASLVERGWAATTAVEVCRRAGVTRGALVHHFETLPVLLSAVLDELYDRCAVSTAERPVKTLEGLVDRTWQLVSEPTFKAVIEAWLAAANDPGLGTDLAPVITAFGKLVSPAGLALDDEEAAVFYLVAREAMLGLALGRATSGGRPLGHEDLVVGRLRDEARRLDRASRP